MGKCYRILVRRAPWEERWQRRGQDGCAVVPIESWNLGEDTEAQCGVVDGNGGLPDCESSCSCVCVESSVRSGKLGSKVLLSAGASRHQWMHVIAPLGTHPPSLPRARPSTAPERGLEYVALRQENTS